MHNLINKMLLKVAICNFQFVLILAAAWCFYPPAVVKVFSLWCCITELALRGGHIVVMNVLLRQKIIHLNKRTDYRCIVAFQVLHTVT